MKILKTFSEFQAEAIADGFDEVLERTWPAHEEVPFHTHPFELRVIVVRGEMWLTVDDETRHLQPGDTFALAHSAPHSERYGAEGAVYWVARRH